MVPGPGRRDVQQAHPLGPVGGLLPRGDGRRIRGSSSCRQSWWSAEAPGPGRRGTARPGWPGTRRRGRRAATIGNSSPLLPCTVRTRTASSSGSATTDSFTRAPSSRCSSSHCTKPRRLAPPASLKACAASVRNRSRRQWSRGRRFASASVKSPRSRITRSTVSAGVSQRCSSWSARRSARPTTTGWSSGSDSGGSWWIDHRPRASRYSSRSASEHPNAGVRSAATIRISSAGSSIAPRIETRSRHSDGREQQRLALDPQRDVGRGERGFELGEQRPGRAAGPRRRRSGPAAPIRRCPARAAPRRARPASPRPANRRSGSAGRARRARVASRTRRSPSEIGLLRRRHRRGAPTGTGTSGSAGRNACRAEYATWSPSQSSWISAPSAVFTQSMIPGRDRKLSVSSSTVSVSDSTTWPYSSMSARRKR